MLALLLAILLPTGKTIDGAGRSIPVGNMPLAMIAAPGDKHVIVSLSGWRHQGLQVVDVAAGKITQELEFHTFLGLAAQGNTIYASGANDNVIHVLKWSDGQLTKDRDIASVKYPAGIAVSADGRRLYAAENLGDSMAVVDVASGKVMQRFATGPYPYGVAVAPDGSVYVSSWAGNTISVFQLFQGELVAGGTIEAGRHPSTLLFNKSGSRLYATLASLDRIAVIDPKAKRVIKYLDDSSGVTREGSTPNALAFSPDESLLYVAEADNNAVAVFKGDKILGRIPADWYPSALLWMGKELLVLNSKGIGTHPNPEGRQPHATGAQSRDVYTLTQIVGTIRVVDPAASISRAADTRQRKIGTYPPFKHVIYIIKENRTYDQIFGDMPQSDADPSLLYFPREVSKNHHALAERFGLFDRFFTNAVVSSQGHMWSTAGYVTDYIEKAVHSLYNDSRPDAEGELEDPAEGYLWTRAAEQKISMRNYGENSLMNEAKTATVAAKPGLAQFTSPKYPAYDLTISDQRRADAWLEEFNEYVRTNTLPTLEVMHLPNDHTAGGRAGRLTPRAYFADNDLALGRIVSAVSKSPYWKDTVIFVVEDDAQDGPDHVDSHRSAMLAISAYNRPGVVHRFVNTTDVLATVEQIIGMRPMSQFDYYSRPLSDVFAAEADLTPYEVLTPDVPLDEKNPPAAPAAKPSASLDLSKPDIIDDDLFNRILWLAIKGDAPYPGPRRATALELLY